jgi:hypothetical protein
VIARVLGNRGYSLVIGGRDRGALETAAADLSRHASVVRPVAGDVTDPAVRAGLIEAAMALGGLDVLVNNASELGGIGPLQVFDVPRFGRLFPGMAFQPTFSWAGTFAETEDHLPCIGRHPDYPNAWFAAAYGGNGVSFGVLAAEIIRDAVCGKRHPAEALFGFDRPER